MDTVLLIGAFTGLIFSIIFSSAEIALISSSKLQIDVWIRQKYKLGKLAKYILNRKVPFLNLILIGTTLSNILAASYFTAYMQEFPALKSTEFLFIPIAIIILIFGEILPKTLIRERANIMLMLLSPILIFFYFILFPILYLISISNFSKERVYTKQENINEFEHAFEQIDDQEEIENEQKEIISNIFDYRKSIANDIMTPIEKITSISIDSNLEELAHLFIDSGHSKIPVYDKDLNDIKGVVYLYDMYLKPNSINDILKEIKFIPYNKKISDIMHQFKKSKNSIAIILDKNGKTSGLITIEDIFEELFGDFEDEFDYEKFKSITLEDESILVNARMNTNDFNKEYNNIIPKGEYETIGGYIINQIGRIPNKNELFFLPIGQVKIIKSSSRRIEQVQIYKN